MAKSDNTNTTAPRSSFLASQALNFLRFIQLGSTVLTGFIACYFVWWHNVLHDEVPSGLISIICACCIAFSENYVSSAYSLSKQDKSLDYRFLLMSTLPSAVAMSGGYYSLRQVPFVRKWCEGDNWFQPTTVSRNNAWPGTYRKVDPGVEQHHCALTCDIIITGAIALFCAILIALFAVVGLVRQNRAGSIKLDDRPEDYSDDLLPGYGDTKEKMDELDAA